MSLVSYTPRPGHVGRTTTFVFDHASLTDLRRQVQQGSGNDGQPSASEVAVARQFEALFIQMMLKQARDSGIKGTLLQSDSMKTVQSMHDEQLALSLAQGQGMGLTEALVEMMRKHNPGATIAPDLVAANTEARNALPSGSARKLVADSIDSLMGLISDGVDLVKMAAQSVTRIVNKIMPSEEAPDHAVEFLNKVSHAAVQTGNRTGIAPELIISQAALESGWGTRVIKNPDGSDSHNIFGIKATANWSGKVTHVMTTEYVDGVPKKVMQPFRSYDSIEEAIADYAKLITSSERYAGVLQAATPELAAREVHMAGYATDPKYSEKLIQIMKNFKAV